MGAEAEELNIRCELKFEKPRMGSDLHSIADLKPILDHFENVLNFTIHNVREKQAKN